MFIVLVLQNDFQEPFMCQTLTNPRVGSLVVLEAASLQREDDLDVLLHHHPPVRMTSFDKVTFAVLLTFESFL